MSNPVLHLTVLGNGTLGWTTDEYGWGGPVQYWGGEFGSLEDSELIPDLDPTYDVVIDYSNLQYLTTELGLSSVDWANAFVALTDDLGNPIPSLAPVSGISQITIPADSGLPNTLFVDVVAGSVHKFTTQITTSGTDSVYDGPNWSSSLPLAPEDSPLGLEEEMPVDDLLPPEPPPLGLEEEPAAWPVDDTQSPPTPTGVESVSSFVVTAVSGSYYIDGSRQDTLELLEGNTYVFDWSGAPTHPFRFSETSDGTHSGGAEYTSGVTVDTAAFTTTIVVDANTPTLEYYCELHPSMGGSVNISGLDDVASVAEALGPDGSWMAPTPVMFDDQLTTLIDGTSTNDMLDLTGIGGVYELDAGFGSWDLGAGYDSDVGIIFIGDQYYEFKGIEGYQVSGVSDPAASGVIRFNALDDINETIEIGSGFGLNINLGVGALSDADVVVFTGGSVDIDMSSDVGSGYISYSYSDDSGSGAIRGADIIIGSTEEVAGDRISGSDQRDVIVGLAGDDQLYGGAGDDFIIGGAGGDVIDGGSGDDIIIDLDADTLTGGEGRDVFVVNGTGIGGSAFITDLDVSEDGLSFRGLDTDKYADRIAFSFNASVLATALSSASGLDLTGLSDPLDAGVYYQLARALDIEVVQNTSGSGADYDLVVSYTDESGTTDLGKVGFDVSDRPADKPAFNEADHVYKATLLQAEEVDKQLTEALLDQIASYATDGVDMPSTQSVTLFVGVERADKNAIFGDGDPILVAYQPEGVQIATKFRPSNADEVMLGSSQSDVYAHSAQVFIDEAAGTATGDQDFGRDTVVERGGDSDVISLEASLSDLLVGHLELGRMERGREGDDRSLNIRYKNDPSDSGDLNGVDLIVYKQFVDYDSTFRVEGLELVDPEGGYRTLSFGEAVSDSDLQVDGATDAILVGREGQADKFTVRDSGSGTAELYMVGFEHDADQLVFAGDENAILSSDPADYADGFEQVTVTGVEGSVTYDIHFVSSIDDDLTTNIPA